MFVTWFGLALLAVMALPTEQRSQVFPARCPFHGRRFGNYCYKYVRTKLNAHAAARYCKLRYNGHLAAIRNANENKFVLGMIKGKAWLLFSDIRKEERFLPRMTYKNWAPREPNNAYSTQFRKDEDCVQMYKTGRYAGRWNDLWCDVKLSFVCKIHRPVIKRPAVRPIVHYSCSRGRSLYNKRCYRVYRFKRTWKQARNYCIRRGGWLASIWSHRQNYFVSRLIGNDNSWIGLSDRMKEGRFYWSIRNSKGKFYLLKARYTNWNKGEPNNVGRRVGRIHIDEDCVHMYGKKSSGRTKWNDERCDKRMGFVCKFAAVIRRPAVRPVVRPIVRYSCPRGKRLYRHRCYQLSPPQGRYWKTWSQASTACKRRGGWLVSIFNRFQNNFVSRLIGNSDAWIGLDDKGIENRFYWNLWGNRRIKAIYKNFAPGEPNNVIRRHWFKRFDEDCVHIYGNRNSVTRRSKWNDERCDKKMRYLCEFRAAVHIIRPVTLKTTKAPTTIKTVPTQPPTKAPTTVKTTVPTKPPTTKAPTTKKTTPVPTQPPTPQVKWVKIDGKFIAMNNVKEIKNKSLKECKDECMKAQSTYGFTCSSIDFDKQKQRCYLATITFKEAEEKNLIRTGSNFILMYIE